MFSRQSSVLQDPVSIFVNHKEVQAMTDDTVAAAVLCAGVNYTRTAPVSGEPRAPFCLMGVCFECLMNIDGIPNQRACMTRVKAGMQVLTQHGSDDVK